MKLKKISLKIANSTNDVAIKKIKSGLCSGIVISQKQKKGRGRYGKKWISYNGNLFVSIFFKIKKNTLLKKITMENCHLVKKSLDGLTKHKISIKKPNDLMIKGKKFCGILQEIMLHKQMKYIIIGIGVNINKSPFIHSYPTTSLREYAKKKINRNIVFTNIRKVFEKNINKV